MKGFKARVFTESGRIILRLRWRWLPVEVDIKLSPASARWLANALATAAGHVTKPPARAANDPGNSLQTLGAYLNAQNQHALNQPQRRSAVLRWKGKRT